MLSNQSRLELVCGLSNISALFVANLEYLQAILNVTKVRTNAWPYAYGYDIQAVNLFFYLSIYLSIYLSLSIYKYIQIMIS